MTTHTSIFDVQFYNSVSNQLITGFQMKYSEFFESWILTKNGVMAGYIFDTDLPRIKILRQVA